MRTVTETITLYTFDDAPSEIKEKIRDNFRCTYDLYEHLMVERIATLKKVAELLGANLDYSLSCVADRGEYIKFIPKYDELDFQALWEAIDVEEDCPLTGCCYDHDFLDHLGKYNLTVAGLNLASNLYIESIHDEYESLLTDEYLSDLCLANEYEFTANGEIYY